MNRHFLEAVAECCHAEFVAHIYRCEHCYDAGGDEAKPEQLCAPGTALHTRWQAAERSAAWPDREQLTDHEEPTHV